MFVKWFSFKIKGGMMSRLKYRRIGREAGGSIEIFPLNSIDSMFVCADTMGGPKVLGNEDCWRKGVLVINGCDRFLFSMVVTNFDKNIQVNVFGSFEKKTVKMLSVIPESSTEEKYLNTTYLKGKI